MSSISIDRSRVLEATTISLRSWDIYALYLASFISIYVLVPEILSRFMLAESLITLDFDRLAFIVLTSTFGFLAFLFELNRSWRKNNPLTGAIFLNTSMLLLLSVVLMYSRSYYSRPYIALFFLINTLACYVIKEYVDRRRHGRVVFLTAQPSATANGELGNEVQIWTDPGRSPSW